MSALDRALDALAAAPTGEAAYGPPGSDNPGLCWRCLAPAGDGPSGVCGACREVLLGDGPIEPALTATSALSDDEWIGGSPEPWTAELPDGATLSSFVEVRVGERVAFCGPGGESRRFIVASVDGHRVRLRAATTREWTGRDAGRFPAQTRAARRKRARRRGWSPRTIIDEAP